ncbi:hypothetical protein V6N13_064053 [Hibiscus sabdariffa]
MESTHISIFDTVFANWKFWKDPKQETPFREPTCLETFKSTRIQCLTPVNVEHLNLDRQIRRWATSPLLHKVHTLDRPETFGTSDSPHVPGSSIHSATRCGPQTIRAVPPGQSHTSIQQFLR